MLLTLSTQVLLPIGLLAWLLLVPANNLIGFASQAAGIASVLLALKLVSLWMLLPWWLPFAYGLLFTLAITLRIRRRALEFERLWPANAMAWTGMAIVVSFGILGGWLSWQAIQGRQLPHVRVVDLPMPLGSGTYLVANGGSREIVNGHLMTLDPDIERLRAYRGQSYGVDLIKIDALGLRAKGLQPRDPAVYAIYNEPVYAPCDGIVIRSRNDRPDMPVPVLDLDVVEGNHVLLKCNDFELLLAHFRPGSVRVRTGDYVVVGQTLGLVGNSGKSSEPHLHVSAQLTGSTRKPFSGDPLAITIDGRYWVRNDRIRGRSP